MTYLELAPLVGKSDRTIIRWLKAANDIPQFLDALNDGNKFSYGKNDNLPLKVCGYLAMTKEQPTENVKQLDLTDQEILKLLQLDKPPVDREVFHEPKNGSLISDRLQELRENSDIFTKEMHERFESDLYSRAEEISTTQRREDGNEIFKAYIGEEQNPIAKMTVITGKQATGTEKLSDKIMHGDTPPVLAVAALVMADAFSFGWLSLKIFGGNYLAVTFFSMLGIAVAYAAIVNAVRYKDKWTAESWLWGFGVFQGLLHATAFEVFTTATWQDINLAIGKLIICICIPLATTGIAIIFKNDDK